MNQVKMPKYGNFDFGRVPTESDVKDILETSKNWSIYDYLDQLQKYNFYGNDGKQIDKKQQEIQEIGTEIGNFKTKYLHKGNCNFKDFTIINELLPDSYKLTKTEFNNMCVVKTKGGKSTQKRRRRRTKRRRTRNNKTKRVRHMKKL